MAATGLYALLSGLAAVAGGWLTLLLSRERMAELGALGAGLLLGNALLGMLPEALHTADPRAPIFVALGYFGMHLVRLLLSPRPKGVGSAWAAMLGLLLHSVFDGAALGIAASSDPRLGLTSFLATVLHKIPEGFSLASIVLAATGSSRLAWLAATAIGAATAFGVGLPLLFVSDEIRFNGVLLGLAAGSFLYVGATDLLPGMAGRGGRAGWLALVGAALMFVFAQAGALHGH